MNYKRLGFYITSTGLLIGGSPIFVALGAKYICPIFGHNIKESDINFIPWYTVFTFPIGIPITLMGLLTYTCGFNNKIIRYTSLPLVGSMLLYYMINN